MSRAYEGPPILLEIDGGGWKDMVDRSERWFGNVLMTQTTFLTLLDGTVEKLEEPHLRAYFDAMRERARTHQEGARELYRSIGREPAGAGTGARSGAGGIVGRVREAAADLVGLAGGAASPWRDLHELRLANVSSMGAFAVAEQLGFSLGLPDTAKIAFDIVAEKSTDDLLLQEFILELAPAAILYDDAAWQQADGS